MNRMGWAVGVLTACSILLNPLTTIDARAEGPDYKRDPFGDGDFVKAPLILDVAYPSKGRAEVGVAFSTSLLDSYNAHNGLMVDLGYNFTETLGINIAVGYLHGTPTPIVVGEDSLIPRIQEKCISGQGCDLNPNVANFDQITGLVSAAFQWSPLYGKINVVSEGDVSMQFYTLLGAGVNGTRRAVFESTGAASFNTLNSSLGDSGFLSGAKVHGVLGLGLKVYVARWLDLRAEVRDVFFADKFDFEGNGTEQTYRSDHFLAQVGAGFVLF